MFVTCTRDVEKIEIQFAITNLTYLTMKNRCTALIENNIITANLPMNVNIFQEITKIEINSKDVIGLENEELAEFSNF